MSNVRASSEQQNELNGNHSDMRRTNLRCLPVGLSSHAEHLQLFEEVILASSFEQSGLLAVLPEEQVLLVVARLGFGLELLRAGEGGRGREGTV